MIMMTFQAAKDEQRGSGAAVEPGPNTVGKLHEDS